MRIKYTPAARTDLQTTKAYIAKTLHNPKAAEHVVKEILNHCSYLKAHPQLGMSLSARTGAETDLRYLVCQHHIVLYRVEGEFILVARILDARTDYMRLLFGELT